jgi:parallel beta-helix repeat protein
MKRLFIIALILFLASWAGAANQNIYLDNAGAGAGSEGDPYGEFSEINWTTGGANSIFDWVDGGHTVFINLKRGVTWREELIPGESGVSGRPITIQPYGAGDDPKVKGSLLITPGTSWTEEDTYWYASVATDPRVVLFDGDYGYRQENKVDVDSEFDWWWDDPNDRLYVFDFADEDPDTLYIAPGIEYADSTISTLAYINGKSYINIDGIVFTHGYSNGILLQNLVSNINITNVEASNFHFIGIRGVNTNTVSDVLIEDCYTSRNGVVGISLSSNNIGWTIRRHHSYRDGIVTSTWQEAEGSHDWPGGMKIWADVTKDTPQIFNIVIEDSLFEYAGVRDDAVQTQDRGAGIWIDTVIATAVDTGIIIRHNLSRFNEAHGIYVESARYAKVYSNIVHDNDNIGIWVASGSIALCSDNLISNNTAYSNTWTEIEAIGYDAGHRFDNNIFKNNIGLGTTTAFKAWLGAANNTTNGSGNVYENNAWGPERTDFINWNDDEDKHDTYAAWYVDYAAADGNTVEDDPLFTNPGGGDFTLQFISPVINRGAPLDYPKLLPGSSWPDSVLTGPCGNGCEIGAYEYPIWGAP